MKIFKYKIEIKDEFYIEMSRGSFILDIQIQGNIPFMWVVTNDLGKIIKRKFKTFNTGEDLPFNSFPNDEYEYIGSYQLEGYIFHVFEQI